MKLGRVSAAAAMSVALAAPLGAQDVLTLARADGQSLRIKTFAAAGDCRGVAVVIGHAESGREALRQQVRAAGIRGGLTGMVRVEHHGHARHGPRWRIVGAAHGAIHGNVSRLQVARRH